MPMEGRYEVVKGDKFRGSRFLRLRVTDVLRYSAAT